MGNCTNKQDSPRSLSMRDINNKAYFVKDLNQNGKCKSPPTSNVSHKQSFMSTAENNNTNPGVGSSSSFNMNLEGGSSAYGKTYGKQQIYADLEQIEELESSNYLQSEMRTLQDETKGFSHRLINPIKIPQQNQISLDVKQNYTNSQQSTTVTRGSGVSNCSQSNSTSSQCSSPSRMQRSSGSSHSISPRARDKKKTACEVRNIIRMQTESYYSSFISLELNDILKSGETMTTVMQHFQFSNNDQVLDLVRDLYNSIINKKNKLSENVLAEHREIVMQFIQQAYLLLDRGIQQLLKTQRRLINMTDSNTSQVVKQPNSELSLQTLELLVESYQIIQYYQLLASSHSYIHQNKWWTKNQNEKDLSSFYKKFIRLSQQLNTEFQDGYSLTPGLPKRQRKEKKHTTAATFSYNIEVPSHLSKSIEIESEKCKEDDDKQASFEQGNSLSPHHRKSYSNSQREGGEQLEKGKLLSSPNKKNPTNFLPLISHKNTCDISKDEIAEQDEIEEEKYQNSKNNLSFLNEMENVKSLNESDYPCKTKINNLQDINKVNQILQKSSYRN